MATNNSARQTHVSPGVYTKEVDLNYAAKTLGITTLGLVGETVKGPAFQPLLVENWRDFVSYFGGTNPSTFKGSGYLKYEAPYIAKSYLSESNQLYVTRVLGLSGANMGAAWAITASGSGANKMLVALLRSRGKYQKVAWVRTGPCGEEYEYDKLKYYVTDVYIKPSPVSSFDISEDDECKYAFTTSEGDFTSTSVNYGAFTIECKLNDGTIVKYPVTLNPQDKNYILNVLGRKTDDCDAYVYVEELYDIALMQEVNAGRINVIDGNKDNNGVLDKIEYYSIQPSQKPVNDIMLMDEDSLTRKHVGMRFLCTEESVNPESKDKNMWTYHIVDDKGMLSIAKETSGKGFADENGYVKDYAKDGYIYEVRSFILASGKREYYYVEVGNIKSGTTPVEHVLTDVVYVESRNLYYVIEKVSGKAKPITCDLNNYKEQYRFASTPWIVSEVKGSATDVELVKLFRFHTISDGDSANTQVKISIMNIRPDEGLFDVVVRSFYDNDSNIQVLERFNKCNLVPGSENYIALKIGSSNGDYVTRSKYITVEVNDDDKVKYSIPAGFLGYPIRNYGGVYPDQSTHDISAPKLQYNVTIDDEIPLRKQYFGLSDLVGIDEDVLSYKGVEAYNGMVEGLTPCFHLDSRIGNYIEGGEVKSNIDGQVVTVDGETGYFWSTVAKENMTIESIEPRIGTEELMYGTIYEDIQNRKFTVLPCGGWDGWDVYRDSRSTGDDFRQNRYKGVIDKVSGEGLNFSYIKDLFLYDLENENAAITSDYYAYLSGIRSFANPKEIDINVLATPGIDYVNNKMLVDEVIEMVEEERADTIYVVTTPDKPFGASDIVSDMFTAQDVVDNLYDSEIDSNYTCTYYPNIQYFDTDNNVYVYIPLTKDAVRNFAKTDNIAYPWFAPAGWERGVIDGERVKKILTLPEQDTLYSGRINFANQFAREGMRIWGNKNLQKADTQLNRINVRRLLLQLRKLISIACLKLVFEPNDNTTKETFLSLVNPILQETFNNRGITDWRIEVDDSVEARERHELPAKIFIKVVPTLEYIDLTFILTPQGAVWDN